MDNIMACERLMDAGKSLKVAAKKQHPGKETDFFASSGAFKGQKEDHELFIQASAHMEKRVKRLLGGEDGKDEEKAKEEKIAFPLKRMEIGMSIVCAIVGDKKEKRNGGQCLPKSVVRGKADKIRAESDKHGLKAKCR